MFPSSINKRVRKAMSEETNANIIEMVVNKMVSNQLDAVYGDVDFFSPKDINKSVRQYSSKNFSPKKLAYGFMPAHPSLFMKKKIYQ